MAEIKIKFDLTFSRRVVTALGAAAVIFCAVPELESENVVLSTYYPAPSGVYTKLITTGNAVFARDGGNVGIGTSNPTAKLDINGNLHLSGAAAPTITFNAGATTLSAPTATSFQIGRGATAHLFLTSAGSLGAGTANPLAPLDVQGDLISRTWSVVIP